jgi:hypothetical protein
MRFERARRVATLVRTTTKPFDVLAEGLVSEISQAAGALAMRA